MRRPRRARFRAIPRSNPDVLRSRAMTQRPSGGGLLEVYTGDVSRERACVKAPARSAARKAGL